MFKNNAQMFRQQNPKSRANMMLAQTMLERGTDSSPVKHPLEGVGRLAQALAGAYIQKNAFETDRAQLAQMNAAILKGLKMPRLQAGMAMSDLGNQVTPEALEDSGEGGMPGPMEQYEQTAMPKPPPPGGLAGAAEALGREDMKGNWHAQQAAPQLAMMAYTQKAAAQKAALDRKNEREDYLYQQQNKAFPPQKLTPGVHTPYPREVAQQLSDIAGAKAGAAESAKINSVSKLPMPAAVIKIVDEHGSAIATAKSINLDFSKITQQLEDNKFDPGLFSRLESSARNYVGASTPESRAYGSYKATLEKIRNDSLRLNKGMQTEGDANRAMNEIISNANDKEFVKLRLKELQAINSRAIELRQAQANSILSQYGRPALKIPGFDQPAQTETASPPARTETASPGTPPPPPTGFRPVTPVTR